MELLLQGATGLPGDYILSARLGEVRRQTRVEKLQTGCIRFPEPEQSASQLLQLQLLHVIGTGRLAVRPSSEEVEYKVAMTSDGPATQTEALPCPPELCFKLRPMQPNEGPLKGGEPIGGAPTMSAPCSKERANGNHADAAEKARRYLEEHGLLGYTQALLHAVLQSRPADPYEFLFNQLANAVGGYRSQAETIQSECTPLASANPAAAATPAAPAAAPEAGSTLETARAAEAASAAKTAAATPAVGGPGAGREPSQPSAGRKKVASNPAMSPQQAARVAVQRQVAESSAAMTLEKAVESIMAERSSSAASSPRRTSRKPSLVPSLGGPSPRALAELFSSGSGLPVPGGPGPASNALDRDLAAHHQNQLQSPPEQVPGQVPDLVPDQGGAGAAMSEGAALPAASKSASKEIFNQTMCRHCEKHILTTGEYCPLCGEVASKTPRRPEDDEDELDEKNQQEKPEQMQKEEEEEEEEEKVHESRGEEQQQQQQQQQQEQQQEEGQQQQQQQQEVVESKDLTSKKAAIDPVPADTSLPVPPVPPSEPRVSSAPRRADLAVARMEVEQLQQEHDASKSRVSELERDFEAVKNDQELLAKQAHLILGS